MAPNCNNASLKLLLLRMCKFPFRRPEECVIRFSVAVVVEPFSRSSGLNRKCGGVSRNGDGSRSRSGDRQAPSRRRHRAELIRFRWRGERRLFACALAAASEASSHQLRGAMRPGRSVSTKNELQAFRSAEALIRRRRTCYPYADPDSRRSSDHQSRSRQRETRAGNSFFRP